MFSVENKNKNRYGPQILFHSTCNGALEYAHEKKIRNGALALKKRNN